MQDIKVHCISCGALVPDTAGPTHRYMESSPGCWHTYGEVLAREYTDPQAWAVHRLTVDSYAVQHPGRQSAQSTQSVCVHLLSLCLVLEQGLDAAYATRVMGTAVRNKGHFSWLTPPQSLGTITVVDVVAAATPAQHCQVVRAWAESAWSAWALHHLTIRTWLPKNQ
jgi:hypothetical protein